MNTLAAVLWKDIINELRTKEIVLSMAAFSVVLVVIFNFSLVINKDNIAQLVPSLLWISIIFVGTLGLSRTFAIEKENSAITGILISPIDRSMLYFAKVVSNLLYVLIVQFLLLFLFLFMFNINLTGNILMLIIVMVLGAVGFSTLGTLFSTMAINTKLRELLLPVILFPVIIPVIINAVKATSLIFSGGGYTEIKPFLNILIAFDIIFLVTSALVYEFVVEES